MRQTNNGIKFTPQWRENLSNAHKGQHSSAATEFKKGHPSPWKGKHLPEDARNKMSLAKIGKKASMETRQKMSEMRKGSKHPCWKGGVTPENSKIRTSVRYKIWSQSCMVKDKFTCQDCGQVGGKLEVHHLKPFHVLLKEAISCLPLLTLYDAAMAYSPMWEILNGQVLCVVCHSKINKRRTE